MRREDAEVESVPAWLTTVTTRLCLDRLRARTPAPTDEIPEGEGAPDPADEVGLAEAVGGAMRVVLDRLTPLERVAFVLHDILATFFNGSARAAVPVFAGDRPGAAWFLRGEAKVLFDFTVADGLVRGITFRAAPEVLAGVARRDRGQRRG